MQKIRNLFAALSGLFLVVVFGVTFAQVIQRYVFHMPMPWATDVIRIAFVYSVFFGMAVGVFNKGHLNIDVLVSSLPQRAKPWFALLADTVELLFLCVVLRYSISFMNSNADQLTPYLLLPMSWLYGVIPLTVALMIAFLVGDVFNVLKRVLGNPAAESR